MGRAAAPPQTKTEWQSPPVLPQPQTRAVGADKGLPVRETFRKVILSSEPQFPHL